MARGPAAECVKCSLRASASALQARLGELAAELKTLRDAVAARESEPTDAELDREIARVQTAVAQLKGQENQPRKGNAPPKAAAAAGKAALAQGGPSEETAKLAAMGPDYVAQALRFYRSQWSARKAACEEVLGTILEDMPAKTKMAKLMEDIGVESDAAAGVSLMDIDR
jgi:hypothetical protein